MAIDRILQLKLITDVSQTTKAVSGVRGRMRGAAAEIGSWTKAAGLGLVVAGIDAVGTSIMQGVADFREGEKASARLGRTWQKLGLDAEQLQGTMDDIGNRAVSLGFDDTESTDLFNKFLNRTKDAKVSSDLLSASWDLARAKGIPLSQAADIVGKAFNGNKKTLRDFGVEGVTGMEAVNAIMVTSKGAAEDYASTVEGKFEVLQGVIGEGFEAAAGVGIGLVTASLPLLESWGAKLAGLWETVQPGLSQLLDIIGPKIGAAIAATGSLIEALAPHFTNAIGIIQPILEAFGTAAGGIFDAITGAIDTITALLNGDLTGAFDGIKTMADGLVTAIVAPLEGLAETLLGLIPNIAAAAGDIASSIFDGLVDGLSGLGRSITDAVVGGIRTGLNALIKIWNDLEIPGMTFHFPAISVPNPAHGTVFDPVGKPNIDLMGASDFQLWGRIALPNIPRLAAGGIVRHRPGGILANIGEGRHDEVVAPLDGSLGNTYVININGVISDPYQLGRVVVDAIGMHESRAGTAWRTA